MTNCVQKKNNFNVSASVGCVEKTVYLQIFVNNVIKPHCHNIRNCELTIVLIKYRVILSVLDPRKCEYLKDYSLHFEHAYMTTYLAS